MKRLVILGGTGFVGRNLAKHLQPHYETISCVSSYLQSFTPEHDCVEAKVRHEVHDADLVINCVGNKDVLNCEQFTSNAYETNAIIAGNIAWVCKDEHSPFIHISSDHAYATPRTVYGDSKKLGDELVRRECPDAIIAVTGHVYDVDCPWVKWLDGELKAGRTVKAWQDIDNRPTYAGDLAAAIMRLVNGDKWGSTYVLTSQQWVSRYQLFTDYAKVNGYDAGLIVKDSSPAPAHYPRHYHQPNNVNVQVERDVKYLTTVEGFMRMKQEAEKSHTN